MNSMYALREIIIEAVHLFHKSSSTTKRLVAWIALAVVLICFNAVWKTAHWLMMPPRPLQIAGIVTHDGTPIENGQIAFEPTAASSAQKRTARISGGRFMLAANEGLAANHDYIVRVSGFRETAIKYENSNQLETGQVFEQYLPRQFNVDSQIIIHVNRSLSWNGLTLEL